jgi:hypothetical protein
MDREKIMQALVTLQETCEEHRCCSECPLRGKKDAQGYVTCAIKKIPRDWEFNFEPWKAFKW